MLPSREEELMTVRETASIRRCTRDGEHQDRVATKSDRGCSSPLAQAQQTLIDVRHMLPQDVDDLRPDLLLERFTLGRLDVGPESGRMASVGASDQGGRRTL